MCQSVIVYLAALGICSSLAAAGSVINSTTQTGRSAMKDGPERCLASDSPFWCLAEETSVGLARTFYPGDSMAGQTVVGKGTSTNPLDILSDLAYKTFDLESASSTETDEEGRSKKKKKYAYFFFAIASVLAVLLPLKLKAIAIMAATALFVGKIALMVASLIGLKKLVHKQSDETTHVHYSGHRSDPDTHYLAYSEHAPTGQFSPDERYQ